jgi:hypothetical protein
MRHDLSHGPAHVADALIAGLRPQRADDSVLETIFASNRLAAQRARRARFIAEQRLSASEAVHIPLDFDPAKEADSP